MIRHNKTLILPLVLILLSGCASTGPKSIGGFGCTQQALRVGGKEAIKGGVVGAASGAAGAAASGGKATTGALVGMATGAAILFLYGGVVEYRECKFVADMKIPHETPYVGAIPSSSSSKDSSCGKKKKNKKKIKCPSSKLTQDSFEITRLDVPGNVQVKENQNAVIPVTFEMRFFSGDPTHRSEREVVVLYTLKRPDSQDVFHFEEPYILKHSKNIERSFDIPVQGNKELQEGNYIIGIGLMESNDVSQISTEQSVPSQSEPLLANKKSQFMLQKQASSASNQGN